MLLAVITYHPLFEKLLTTVDAKSKTEITDRKEINTSIAVIGNTADTLRKTVTKKYYTDGMSMTETKTDTLYAQAGKTTIKPDMKISKLISGSDYRTMVLLVFIMILYVTMVYGPIAAFLVELFPTKIRYTSMSLPYHIGNGVFGGLTPFIATLLTTIYTDNKLAGLTYPLIVAAVCLVIGTLYISNRIDKNVND